MNLDRFAEGFVDIQDLDQCLFCGNTVYLLGNQLCPDCEDELEVDDEYQG